MKSFFAGAAAVLGSAALIAAALILSIEMFALSPEFYKSEYNKLDTAQSIGMSETELSVVTENLIDYTSGARETLDMQAEIKSQTREVFNKREKDHMVDVKALYLGARDVRSVCLICAAVMLAAALILGGNEALRLICRSFLRVSGVFVLIIAALAIYAAVDFTGFWVSFHHLFFTNDLWQLDPRTDVLIMMVPQQFFSDLVARIIIRFVSIFAGLNIAAAAGSYIIGRKNSRQAKQA